MNYAAMGNLDVFLMMLQKQNASSSLNEKDEVAEAMKEFHENVLVLGGGSKEVKPAKGFKGIYGEALVDWMRSGVTIGDSFYEGALSKGGQQAVIDENMLVADEKLIALCKDNAKAALWLSLFGHLQILFHFFELFKKLPIKLMDDYCLDVSRGNTSYAFSALKDGGVRLAVGYQWDRSRAVDDGRYKEFCEKKGYSICSDSKFSASFSLRFDISDGDEMPGVSIWESLEYKAQIFLIKPVEEEWAMFSGDQSKIEVYVEQPRQYSGSSVEMAEYSDADGKVGDAFVMAGLIGVEPQE